MQHTSCISRRSWVLAGPHYKYFAQASWGGWKVGGWLRIRPDTTRDQSLAQQRTRSCKVGIPWDLWWRRPHQGLRSPWHRPEMPTCMDVAGSCCKDRCCLCLVPWYKSVIQHLSLTLLPALTSSSAGGTVHQHRRVLSVYVAAAARLGFGWAS